MELYREACEQSADAQLERSWRPAKRRPKKRLQSDLQNEIVQEIETLSGRQSIADLDFEAFEMATRRQTLRLPARASNNGSMPTPAIRRDRSCPVAVEVSPLSWPSPKTFESVLGLCIYNALTVTVRYARVDSARGTEPWGWNGFR